MSLIPYQPQEGREIVLRHRNAIVVRDSTSHRLEIRGLTECPTCRRPFPRGSSNTDRSFESSYDQPTGDSYVDPDYFRMLQAGTRESQPPEDPPSSVKRLFQPPALGHASRTPPPTSVDEPESTEFLSSSPGISQSEGTSIRKQAFSPGYFKTFFKEEKVLGKGGKGVVLLVRHEIDNCDLGHFACKRVPVGDDHTWLEKVLVEVGLLNKLSHPNLVSYRHVWLESTRLTRFGPSVACAFILQQYCNGGDLHQYIVGSAPREATTEELKAQMRRRSKGHAERPQDVLGGSRQLSFEEIYSLFRDITSGVAYLHSNNYIHRDLKPNNCLLHREGGKLRCLISDFGEVQPEHAIRNSTGSTGTISYCAPEVLQQDESGQFGNFTTKSDIFSLGMILYFICFGALPYRSANAIQEELEDYDELRAEISEWKGFQDERRKRDDLPPRLYTWLKRLLSLDPLERPSASEVLSALRGESVFGNNSHDRVQNLDSPARGSTPVPGSTGLEKPRAPHVLSTVERPHPLALVQNQEYAENETSSPDALRSPPLLMAPPRSIMTELRHQTNLFLVATGFDGDTLNQGIRLGFFLVKILTLLRPCWPYTVRLDVGVPLLLVAALDMRVPSSGEYQLARQSSEGDIEFGPSRWRGLLSSLVMIALHAMCLWIAGSQDALCALS
ncbi:serine/threonine-protein kinase-like protein [Emericellopsis cladophorae]|uniref:non-specific serine/threonine protein kinase n=1 Tax=Emericellopsis cladophorae TaxID=2686198 RepID=A0A9Q0BCY2_9HYPO|nr:serine/threonine-protein kinase-like protein [Emericellopsis cladophorae]KAI6781292.1 serine/threonine-protein kinase-like protein [Emericellopsis cladophorae]